MTETENQRGRGVAERVIQRLRQMMTIDKVYGTPIEKGGMTLIPVASIRIGGGGGGGGGSDDHASGSGEGAGFGAVARPVGVYVIEDGNIRWKPALDIVRLVVVANLTAVAYFFFTWRIERARARRK
jgi:uncharacterized spore protein YtfJ